MYTLRQAAKATGKSKSSIQNAIKKGRISASLNDLGHYQIDPAELHRVYPPVSHRPVDRPVEDGQFVPPKSEEMDTQNIIKIKELEAELKYANKRIVDLEKERNDWQQQAQTLLLTQGEKQDRRVKTIWQWLGLTRKTA